MIDKIKQFQKAAKASGRDVNSMEEFKVFLQVAEDYEPYPGTKTGPGPSPDIVAPSDDVEETITSARELGEAPLRDSASFNTGASYFDEIANMGIYFDNDYVEIYSADNKIVATISMDAKEDLET